MGAPQPNDWQQAIERARQEGIQEGIQEGRQNGFNEGIAFHLPCRSEEDWNFNQVQQAFEVLFPQYNIAADVSTIKAVKKGNCIWSISLMAKNYGEINTDTAIALAAQFRRQQNMGKFLWCGRCGLGNYRFRVEYQVHDCHCISDFNSAPTQFPKVSGQPRIHSDVTINVNNLITVLKSVDDGSAFDFLAQIIDDDAKNNGREVKIEFSTEIEDEDGPYLKTEEKAVKPQDIVQCIITQINSCKNHS